MAAAPRVALPAANSAAAGEAAAALDRQELAGEAGKPAEAGVVLGKQEVEVEVEVEVAPDKQAAVAQVDFALRAFRKPDKTPHDPPSLFHISHRTSPLLSFAGAACKQSIWLVADSPASCSIRYFRIHSRTRGPHPRRTAPNLQAPYRNLPRASGELRLAGKSRLGRFRIAYQYAEPSRNFAAQAASKTPNQAFPSHLGNRSSFFRSPATNSVCNETARRIRIGVVNGFHTSEA